MFWLCSSEEIGSENKEQLSLGGLLCPISTASAINSMQYGPDWNITGGGKAGRPGPLPPEQDDRADPWAGASMETLPVTCSFDKFHAQRIYHNVS
jgi:hypothetical protein